MFEETKNGKLECTKEELDKHIKETYTYPKKNDRLPQLRKLKHPKKPNQAFKLSDYSEKEASDFVKKARAKSEPGGDRVPYKEKDSKDIFQFRPISTLNVDGKIFMGILAKRTMNYLQANSYINEEVQKAGLPGVPGCIEHVSAYGMLSKKLQKRKVTCQ